MKRNVLCMELKKAFQTKMFAASLLIMSLVACLSAVYSIEVYRDNLSMLQSISPDGNFSKNYMLPVLSSYSAWIGNETRSLMQALFYMLIPVAAVFPFGSSFLSEEKSGYLRNVAVRISMPFYYFAKALACFCSAFTAVVLPMLLNFLVVSAVMPSSLPHAGYEIYYVVYFGDFFSDLFYSQPLLFVVLNILLPGLFAGVIALLAFTLSLKIKNKYVILFLPFLFFLGIEYLASFVLRNVDGNVWGYEFSLTTLLHASVPRGDKVWWMAAGQMLLLLGCTIPVLAVRSKKNEVF